MRYFLATFSTPLTKMSQRVQNWPEDNSCPPLSSGCSFCFLSQKCKLVDHGFLNFPFSLLHFGQMNLNKSRLLGRRQACKFAVSCWFLSFTSIYDPPAHSKVGYVLTAARSATKDSFCEILSFAPKKCVNRWFAWSAWREGEKSSSSCANSCRGPLSSERRNARNCSWGIQGLADSTHLYSTF